MIEHVGRHLPVYKLQFIDETPLLFPLTMRNKTDEKQQTMEEREPKLTDSEEENETPSVEHLDSYEGLITRSKIKKMENALLLKTNTLMSNHFNNQ